MKKDAYDVVVVGGGHAGVEAAAAAARIGADVLLVTQQYDQIGVMSCNPAIGGIGKGHLVKELDALDGLMAKAADHAGIHIRVLNRSKGPAARGTRLQTCRVLYKQSIQQQLSAYANLHIVQQEVVDIHMEGHRAAGVVTRIGRTYRAGAVVLTVGTFLGGMIHLGDQRSPAGRMGDAPSVPLAERLRALPFRVSRLKTGTPPRLDGRTVDYDVLTAQPGDDPRPCCSMLADPSWHPAQKLCWIAHTTPATHAIIRAALSQSPAHNGSIGAKGPRYCPSIEDKVVRFADKPSHQIFLEPEGLHTEELYPNGLSTSLPYGVQEAYLRSIPGLSRVHMTRPGYAIAYDYCDPRDLEPWLETRHIKNLLFAGQINGTTGYEEAAAQGVVAGINASRLVSGLEPWYPQREEAYIGVLLDDLTAKGVIEPYRMFSSRAEMRLYLREDNADQRLTAQGMTLGVISSARKLAYERKQQMLARVHEVFKHTVHEGRKLIEHVKQPSFDLDKLAELQVPGWGDVPPTVWETAMVDVKYAGYVQRQRDALLRARRFDNMVLPKDLDYQQITGLSHEVIEQLSWVRPHTLAQAKGMPGITPAAISLLLVYLKKHSVKSV